LSGETVPFGKNVLGGRQKSEAIDQNLIQRGDDIKFAPPRMGNMSRHASLLLPANKILQR